MKCQWCKKNFPKGTYHACDYSRMRDELYCSHGVGHSKGVHGCDGCCSTPEWKAAWKKYRVKGARRRIYI